MPKAYIVTAEESYYDNEIVGVYSTPELAHEAARMYRGDVSTYDMDVIPAHPPGLFPFRVETGETGISVAQEWMVEPYPEDGGERYVDKFVPRSMYSDGRMISYVWATDAQHAVDIVAEIRAQYLAKSGQSEST